MDGFDFAPGAIVRKDSIEELCGHRARALELYRQATDMLSAAKEAHARACVGNTHINPPALDKLRWNDAANYLKEARENIDRDMWRAFLVNTPLGSLMDLEERKKFDESLNNPPEVTPEVVFANMDRLRCEAGVIFRRGLVNAFRNLSRDYRSHDGFKIGERAVLEYVVSVDSYTKGNFWVRLTTRAEERLRDLDRVFHVLDGKPAPEYAQGLCQAMRDCMGISNQTWQTTTPYFRVKWFKNGNAHLHFLRADLVRQANRMIAEHYGQAVGAAPDVATKRASAAPPPAPALDDFFPTPPDLARRMVDLAEIGPDDLVLEPSAGEGDILHQLPVESLARVTCYEAHDARAAKLLMDYPAATTHCADFLDVEPKKSFDRVLMNPPFSGHVDTRHVSHALAMLRPGGRLVAILSGSFISRRDDASAQLRAELGRLGARFWPIPAGTFKESGTMVSTVLVAVSVP